MRHLNMRPNKTPGILITFCGLDGCGKTTMMKRLIAELEKDHDLFVTKQPIVIYCSISPKNSILKSRPPT